MMSIIIIALTLLLMNIINTPCNARIRSCKTAMRPAAARARIKTRPMRPH